MVAITSYANNNMRLVAAAKEAGIDHRTLSLRLDGVYRSTKLDPKNFFDLGKLVDYIQREGL